MPYQNLLLVEGRDDQHAIRNLLRRRGMEDVCLFDLDMTEVVEAPAIAVKAVGGYEKLRRELPIELAGVDVVRVGVVVDADTDPASRWQSLRDALSGAGVPDMPSALGADGWVGTMPQQTGTLAVGAWLFPDCQSEGALEEFVARLVPEPGRLWTYAEACIEALPEQRFEDKDESKALVHTWLAWQERPRMPIGLAISRGYFDPESEAASGFVDWVRRLFDLQ